MNAPPLRDRFWELPLGQLTAPEWEALCDGCGQCCIHKLEDADTGAFYATNVACRLLDTATARCRDYPGRLAHVPDCLRLTPQSAGALPWLPETCAYRLRASGAPLPGWHYLICGDPGRVHAEGVSVAGRVISEDEAGPLESHVVWPEGMEPLVIDDEPDTR
jgi:uncharacterized cysteine cluster protein YcgN (CxxCxxCC family)